MTFPCVAIVLLGSITSHAETDKPPEPAPVAPASPGAVWIDPISIFGEAGTAGAAGSAHRLDDVTLGTFEYNDVHRALLQVPGVISVALPPPGGAGVPPAWARAGPVASVSTAAPISANFFIEDSPIALDRFSDAWEEKATRDAPIRRRACGQRTLSCDGRIALGPRLTRQANPTNGAPSEQRGSSPPRSDRAEHCR